jgi:hypothetical protein
MSKRAIAGVTLAVLIGIVCGTIGALADQVHGQLYPRDHQL